ncbi:MAG: hypothetical protein ACYSWO_26105 [Planctomycetota bacterium]
MRHFRPLMDKNFGIAVDPRWSAGLRGQRQTTTAIRARWELTR